MIKLTLVHWVYLIMVLVIIATMAVRRDTVMPCIIGIFLVGLVSTSNIWMAVQVLFNALIAAGYRIFRSNYCYRVSCRYVKSNE